MTKMTIFSDKDSQWCRAISDMAQLSAQLPSPVVYGGRSQRVTRGNKSELRKALRLLGAAIAARSRVANPDDPMLQAWLARMARWQEELRDHKVVTE